MQLLVYGPWINSFNHLKCFRFYSAFAFVQLYPIPLNDRSGPEDFIVLWHVDGFGESGEIVEWDIQWKFSSFDMVFLLLTP